METPKTFKELFANTGIEPTTDESGNTHYNFKASMKDTLGKEFYESADKTIKVTKQETLEEVAEKYAEPYRCPATNENEYCKHDIISAFNKGAKWQQERSYSEEEVYHILAEHTAELFKGSKMTLTEWFDNIKKK